MTGGQQLRLPELVVVAPPRPPDGERDRREARSEATLAALLRNLASGTRAVDAEAAERAAEEEVA